MRMLGLYGSVKCSKLGSFLETLNRLDMADRILLISPLTDDVLDVIQGISLCRKIKDENFLR